MIKPKQPAPIITYLLLLALCFTACKKKDVEAPSAPVQPVHIPTLMTGSSYTLGNLQRGIQDTFVLKFNKPVKVNYIMLLSNVCSPNLKWHTADSGTTVMFYDLRCGWLGKDFRFECSVRDSDGKTKKDTVSFSYYKRKFPTTGSFVNLMVTTDNKYCWVTTKLPNQLYCFGIEDTSYKRVYPLTFEPAKIVFNPFNQRLYLPVSRSGNAANNKVFVLNPNSGDIEKVITLRADQYDDPSLHLEIVDLDFGDNGYGVIITQSNEYWIDYRWRIIDSRLHDSIYAHPQWVASLNTGRRLDGFYFCSAGDNKTKIYLNMGQSEVEYGVLDCNTERIATFRNCLSRSNHYIVPNKIKDQVFIASTGYQGVQTEGNCGNYSEFSNNFSYTADFSYRKKDDRVVYYRGLTTDGYYNYYEFAVIDYSKAKILMRTNIPGDFLHITSTTDGKYMLATVGNEVFLFDTDMFYQYI